MDLVLASNNKNKMREIKEMMGEKFSHIISLKELGLDIDVVEDGDSFFANAFKKAKEISDLTGRVALADDSGLVVNCLNGQPGVHSARYAGDAHDDEANIDLLLKNMENAEDRSAYFITVLVLYHPDGSYVQAEGRVYGYIARERAGENGFGYDPVFYSTELKKTFAQADAGEKNSVSHRANALKKLLELL